MGSGSSGWVCKATRKATADLVAMKTIDKSTFESEYVKSALKSEIQVMFLLENHVSSPFFPHT